ETRDGKDRFHIIFFDFPKMVVYGVKHGNRALLGGACGQDGLREQYALVLIRQEGGRHAHEQEARHYDQAAVDQQIALSAAQHLADARLVLGSAAVEYPVEPAEEAFLVLVVSLGNGLE